MGNFQERHLENIFVDYGENKISQEESEEKSKMSFLVCINKYDIFFYWYTGLVSIEYNQIFFILGRKMQSDI